MRHAQTARPACGFDFGTSNSTIAVADGNRPRLVALEGDEVTLPSAMFYGFDPGDEFLIGRAAVAAYVDGVPGRLMRSLKSILGTALIDERTQVARRRVAFRDIIKAYVAAVKRRAEAEIGAELGAIVHGRPVHFVDDDEAGDRQAEDTLRQIAIEAGYREVSFQYEPIAAAYDFEQQVDREQVALIADIGGGTSDFTVVRLGPDRARRPDRTGDILSTGGIRLGGTDYDRYLSMAAFMPLLGYGSRQQRGDIDVPSAPYWELSTWSKVHLLHEAGRMQEFVSTRRTAAEPALIERLIHVVAERQGHTMLMAVEAAKIGLSDAASHVSDLSFVEAGLSATATRDGFEKATAHLFERLRMATADCIRHAGLTHADVSTVFFTGGTSSAPSVRRAVLADFGSVTVVDGDRFGSVGTGLAIEAARRYG
jgi:Molecular chaperone